tara:strand:+ start:513 stop:620 length:108 start_codon:yes stop_codon:yes gene_type:complete
MSNFQLLIFFIFEKHAKECAAQGASVRHWRKRLDT